MSQPAHPHEPAASGRPDERSQLPTASERAVLQAMETDWRRLSPKMLLVHPVQAVAQFLPALIAIFLFGRNDRDNYWWELLGLAGVIAFGMTRYFTTRFRIEGGQIELASGVLNQKRLATPADRVRTVDLTSSVPHRVLGLAKVEIGTGATGGGDTRLVLDALPLTDARQLRSELIHYRNLVQADPVPSGQSPDSESGDPPAEEPTERVLATMHPSWLRFGPLTLGGVITALAILGFGQRFLESAFVPDGPAQRVVDFLEGFSRVTAVAVVLVGVAAFVTVLSIIGYALQYWGFRLTESSAGTLHMRRGLLTTRETSLETKRLRGVELGEHLGLRLAHGARLAAITTGLRRDEQDKSALLLPPAPREVVLKTAIHVLHDAEPVVGPLRSHSRAALRRRLTRAMVPVLVAAVAVALVRHEAPVWLIATTLVALPAAAVVGWQRYLALAHTVVSRFVVVRSGFFARKRSVIEREGVIGFTLRESFFQRRAGVSTLTLTTAAGKHGYAVIDLSPAQAVTMMVEVNGGLIQPFLAGAAIQPNDG